MAAQLKPNLQRVPLQRVLAPPTHMVVSEHIKLPSTSLRNAGIHAPRMRSSGRGITHLPSALAPPHVPPTWSIGTDCEDVMGRLRETDQLRNCLGSPLTEEEQRSLLKCLDSAKLGVDTCLVDGLPALHSHLMDYISEVAYSQTDDLELVEGAMLLIEQLSLALGPEELAAAQGDSPPQTLFSGQWQMLISTGGAWPYGRLQYVPFVELINMSEDGGSCRLESQAGPLYTQAIGDVTWVQPPYHFHYHVTEFRVEVFGGSLTLPAPAPDNDLFVFAYKRAGGGGAGAQGGATGASKRPGGSLGSTALARSSLGGLTLMGQPM